MARKMAPTMAAMTSATPAQRAGDTSDSWPFLEPRLGLLRFVVPPALAEAMRRVVERVREVTSSIHADCGTLSRNTIGGVPERGSLELERAWCAIEPGS